MQILHNSAPITAVTPGGAPIYVPGFGVQPVEPQNMIRGLPVHWLQIQADSVDAGDANPRVINVVADAERLLVTRGVGENAHVATLRALGLPASYFTSWLYPIDSEITQIQAGGAIAISGNLIVWPVETVKETSVIPLSGTLDLVLKQYTLQLPETVKETSVIPLSGTLDVVLKQYTFQLAETVKEAAVTPLSGTLVVTLVSYTLQLSETVKESSVYPLSGTLV